MSTVPERTIPFGRPWITEADRAAVLRVLDGPVLTHGPESKAFEAEFAAFVGGGVTAIAVSSGMAALHLSALALGLGAGDEVIVPAQTHSATAHAFELVGAQPVFVDCDPATGNLTAAAIAGAMTPRTKAIAVVHFVGIPCDMTDIAALAAERELSLIEDCALAVGATWRGRHVGTFGDAGCFSLYPVKHITTGEGGMLITRRPKVARAAALLRGLGVDRTHQERTIPGMYDVPGLGLNYRMSELAAALGRSQLSRIGEILQRRSRNFAALRAGLSTIPGVRILDGALPAVSGHYCLSALLEDGQGLRRDAVVARLNAAGVGTSIYYPQPVPRMRYYRMRYGYDAARFPNAEAVSDRSIALPVGPHLDAEDIRYISDVFRRSIEEEGQ